jgi:hypothetical protein
MAKLTGSHPSRSSHLKHPTPAARSTTAKHHLAHNLLFSDSDGGVEGDIESSTTAGADTLSSHRVSHHYHHYQNSTSSLSTLSTPATASPSAAVQPSGPTIPKVDSSLSTRPNNSNSITCAGSSAADCDGTAGTGTFCTDRGEGGVRSCCPLRRRYTGLCSEGYSRGEAPEIQDQSST